MPRRYWTSLFTWETWQEFLKHGGSTSGFRAKRWPTVSQIQPGDYLLCYLTGLSRWIGLLEVVSKPFTSEEPIWGSEAFSSRVGVKVIAKLQAETAVPVLEMREELSIFQNLKNPAYWMGPFRGSPTKWSEADGDHVVQAVLSAVKNPVHREYDKAKLGRAVGYGDSSIGLVSTPDDPSGDEEVLPESSAASDHTEIQHLLAKLGGELGLDIWIARNDRNRSFGGRALKELPRVVDELPLNFDPTTMKTVEMIYLLWLDGNANAAAFEIEATTAIYSGLLRMSDLLAMQPNISVPLYLVAPDARRDKVLSETNRATFRRLTPPLCETCRFLPFDELRTEVKRVGEYTKHMKPDFLTSISESCEPDEA